MQPSEHHRKCATRGSPVRRLSRGPGRDFVVGDIHGMFHLVKQALDQVSFDPTRDRLLSLGDTVDRGPHSRLAREFLQEPWVHAVRGNHEQMFLDCYQGGQLDAAALDFHVRRNGGAWWMELDARERQALLETFEALPLALHVETDRGTVGLVHAEVPPGMDWPSFCAALESGDPATHQTALWGRSRSRSGDRRGVAGIDRVFSGHTIVGQVRQLGNIFYVDTGAFLRAGHDEGHLSVANLAAATSALIAVPALPPSPWLRVFDRVSKTPFSAYFKS